MRGLHFSRSREKHPLRRYDYVQPRHLRKVSTIKCCYRTAVRSAACLVECHLDRNLGRNRFPLFSPGLNFHVRTASSAFSSNPFPRALITRIKVTSPLEVTTIPRTTVPVTCA